MERPIVAIVAPRPADLRMQTSRLGYKHSIDPKPHLFKRALKKKKKNIKHAAFFA